MDWLPWAPPAAAVTHISEEFLWPGGLAAWYPRYVERIVARLALSDLIYNLS